MLITSTSKAKSSLIKSNPKPSLPKNKFLQQKKTLSHQHLLPLKPSRPDVGCQCEDCSDSELFEDSENVGVTIDNEISNLDKDIDSVYNSSPPSVDYVKV